MPVDPAKNPTPQNGANTFLPVDPDNHDGELKTKIVLLSGFSDKQLHDIIDAYKSNKLLPKAIFATVTDQSNGFVLKDLLAELRLEAETINSAQKPKV